jgi:hypothetical protein
MLDEADPMRMRAWVGRGGRARGAMRGGIVKVRSDYKAADCPDMICTRGTRRSGYGPQCKGTERKRG